MQGEDGDQVMSSFHKTELEGPILIGGVPSRATPEQLGPRNVGQAGVDARDAVAKTKLKTQKRSLFGMN
jgi:hypothetical protein